MDKLVWQKYVHQFGEVGLEVYRGITKEAVETVPTCPKETPALDMLADLEVIKDTIYRLAEIPEDDARSLATTKLKELFMSFSKEARLLL